MIWTDVNSVSPLSLCLSATYLPRHYDLGRRMLHLAHCSAISCAKFTKHYQVFRFQVQPELDANLKGIVTPLFIPEGSRYLRVASRGSRFGRGCAECKALDVLPFHCLRLERGVRHGDGGGLWRRGGVTAGEEEATAAVVARRWGRRLVVESNVKDLQRCRSRYRDLVLFCRVFRDYRPLLRQEYLANHGKNQVRRATASIGLTASGRVQRQASKATEMWVPDMGGTNIAGRVLSWAVVDARPAE